MLPPSSLGASFRNRHLCSGHLPLCLHPGYSRSVSNPPGEAVGRRKLHVVFEPHPLGWAGHDNWGCSVGCGFRPSTSCYTRKRCNRLPVQYRDTLYSGGFVGFHALQEDDYGRIGRGGFWTVVVAALALVVGLIVRLLSSMALEELFFPVATLAVFTGFVLYGAATLQARVLPRWCGIGFIVGPFVFLWGDFGGILFGLLWLALGYMLWSQRDTFVGQPSRVS